MSTTEDGSRDASVAARAGTVEMKLEVTAEGLLGYIEYPSHLERALDWPVGMAFRTELATSSAGQPLARPDIAGWFSQLPDEMHDEQTVCLPAHGLADTGPARPRHCAVWPEPRVNGEEHQG
jgi:hypothetical protein